MRSRRSTPPSTTDVDTRVCRSGRPSRAPDDEADHSRLSPRHPDETAAPAARDALGGRRVDRLDAPVVIARGVVDDLPHLPAVRALPDHEARRTPGVWPRCRCDRARRSSRRAPPATRRRGRGRRVRRPPAAPRAAPGAIARCAPAPGRPDGWSTTSVGGGRHDRAVSTGSAAGRVSAAHSSSRLESTWRTSSPSHSTMSRSSSVLASSGIVWRAAR